MLDVLTLYRELGSTGYGPGPMAPLRVSDPPAAVWEGLHLYLHAIAKVREDEDKKKDKKRQAEANAQAKFSR